MEPALFWALIKGVVIGVLVAAPIGPVNIIVMQRTLAYGRLNAVASGFGAAVGDGIFALVAAFGLTAVTGFVADHRVAIESVSILLVLGMGIRTALTPGRLPTGEAQTVDVQTTGLVKAMLSVFALTITNPMTMLGFAAIFAGAGGLITGQGGFGEAGLLVAGTFLGSMLWWLTVAILVGFLHHMLDARGLTWVNRISGGLIAGFGVVLAVRLVMGL